jgi:acyl carrier protein
MKRWPHSCIRGWPVIFPRKVSTVNVEDKVTELISRASGVPVAEIMPEAKLSDLDMESLEKLECVMSLEDALKVEIKEDDLWRLKTVQDVIDAFRRVMPSPA